MDQWDEGTDELDPDDDQQHDDSPPDCRCLHERGCRERWGHLRINWARVLGREDATGPPLVLIVEPVGERCDCEHDDDCPWRDDDEEDDPSWLGRLASARGRS